MKNKMGCLWDLMDDFQDIFAWHKGELGHCTIGEHTIDAQALPPRQMTPTRLSYYPKRLR
jgi:hypothetical protein